MYHHSRMSGATDADGGAAYYPVMQTDLCATDCDIRSTTTQNMNYSLAVHQSAPFFEMPGNPTPLYPTGEFVYRRPSSGQGETQPKVRPSVRAGNKRSIYETECDAGPSGRNNSPYPHLTECAPHHSVHTPADEAKYSTLASSVPYPIDTSRKGVFASRHGSDSSWSYESSPESPPLATPPHQHPLSAHGDTYVSDDLNWQHDADWDTHVMGSCQRVNTVELQFSMQAHHLQPNDHSNRSGSYPMSNLNVHGVQGTPNMEYNHSLAGYGEYPTSSSPQHPPPSVYDYSSFEMASMHYTSIESPASAIRAPQPHMPVGRRTYQDDLDLTQPPHPSYILSIPVGSPPQAPLPVPPPVEDTPKKPLTLACFFCRKRKIACGSPPPGKIDRTCNQCARRNLKCVYPEASRRGMRPKVLYEKDMLQAAGLPVPVS